jgi:hypothetical protein
MGEPKFSGTGNKDFSDHYQYHSINGKKSQWTLLAHYRIAKGIAIF